MRGPVVALALGLALSPGALGCFGKGGATPTPTVTPAPVAGPVALPDISDPAALTEAEIDAMVAFLSPYVERAAGARFTSTPPGRLGTPDALRDVLHDESRSVLGKIYDVPPEVIEQLAAGARAGVPGLLGKYASATGAVYLVPENVAAMGQGDPARATEAAWMILAHELAHALQDQVANLDDVLGRLEDYDHFDGMRGITEGHANWVTLRVARELGREDAFWRLARSQGWGPEGLVEPQAFAIFMLYGQGMAMCEHHAAAGGTDRLWEMVKAPPRSTTMLFRPERYAPDLELRVDLRGAMRGVEDLLTANVPWVPTDSLLGEGALRGQLVGLPEPRVASSLEGISWAFERRMFSEGGSSAGPRNAAVRVIMFDSPEGARALVELLTDGLAAQAKARSDLEAQVASASPGFTAREWVVEAVPYDRIPGDVVVRRVVGPSVASGARLALEEEQALWVVRGQRVVVVTVSGFRPGNRLDRAVDEVFSRLDALAPTP